MEEKVKPVTIDAISGEIYRHLQLYGASELLDIVGAWKAGVNDAETLEALRKCNSTDIGSLGLVEVPIRYFENEHKTAEWNTHNATLDLDHVAYVRPRYIPDDATGERTEDGCIVTLRNSVDQGTVVEMSYKKFVAMWRQYLKMIKPD